MRGKSDRPYASSIVCLSVRPSVCLPVCLSMWWGRVLCDLFLGAMLSKTDDHDRGRLNLMHSTSTAF